jgi:hypothetical protein
MRRASLSEHPLAGLARRDGLNVQRAAAHSMTAPALTVRPMAASPDDARRFKHAFDVNEEERDLAKVEWQYLKNPGGGPLVDFAIDPQREDDALAGIYAVFPSTFTVGGRVVTGVQSLDTLTDTAYRGRGVFTMLAGSMFARCIADRIGFVYGFPNANSAPGFFRKLAWQVLDPVPLIFLPLRSRYFLARIPRIGRFLRILPDISLRGRRRVNCPEGSEIAPVTHFDDRWNDLWDAFATQTPVALRRDARYLAWRFQQKPGERYTTLALSRGQELLGFVTFTLKAKTSGRMGYLMELVARPEIPGAARCLLETAVNALRADRADAVQAWCLEHSPTAPVFRDVGFRPLPERMRPWEVHFGVRAFDETLRTLLECRDSWYISLADSDTT